jgi:choline dehydrogenase-like flavoprotein
VLADARSVPHGAAIDADVCIVGGGAAGITLARELSAPTRRVVLLESGFDEPDPATQSLYDGVSRGVPYFALGDETTRTRQFGGSTNQWNGECRPLSELDFEPRTWLPGSGWPFDLAHLRPYYDRAQAVCELGPYGYTAVDESLDGAVECTLIQYSAPTRFGPQSRDAFARAASTTVYLGANVVDLVVTPSGRALERVEVVTIAGDRFTVRARSFVLATGGVENARLLLASDGVVRGGIGNAHDLVGRSFMEHLYLDDAAVIVADRRFAATFGADRQLDGHRVRNALTLSDSTQRAEGLPGSTFVVGAQPSTRGWARRANATIRRIVDMLRSSVAVPVKHIQEQVPNRDSRVLLADERDRLGSRRVVLDWRVSDDDRTAAARSHAILDGALRAAGIGRVVTSRLDGGAEWPAGLRGARHHMGTTRMHPDPTRGVVDADCRVHGVANLYVAGSSVFPTSGTANPTLTIVALALRLADHLGTVVPRLGIPE